MKTSVIFSEGIKQIFLQPENDDEKFALSLITAKDDIELLVKNGSIFSAPDAGRKPFTASVDERSGGHLRIYEGGDGKVLILKPKKNEN